MAKVLGNSSKSQVWERYGYGSNETSADRSLAQREGALNGV
jgi:hypothetical protein